MWVTTTLSVCLLGLIVLSEATNATPVAIQADSVVSAGGDKIFLAPFTSTAFIEAAKIEAARLQVELERQIGVYFHKKADLVWAARDNGSDIDWLHSFDYCTELSLAGLEDWRLPSLDELHKIMKPRANREYATPAEIFLTACCQWSSTPKTDRSAWNFNYKFRRVNSASMTHTYDLRALCVRAHLDSDPELLGQGLIEDEEEDE